MIAYDWCVYEKIRKGKNRYVKFYRWVVERVCRSASDVQLNALMLLLKFECVWEVFHIVTVNVKDKLCNFIFIQIQNNKLLYEVYVERCVKI